MIFSLREILICSGSSDLGGRPRQRKRNKNRRRKNRRKPSIQTEPEESPDPPNFDPGTELKKFWDNLATQEVQIRDENSEFTNGHSGNFWENMKEASFTPLETPPDFQEFPTKDVNAHSETPRNCEGLACTA